MKLSSAIKHTNLYHFSLTLLAVAAMLGGGIAGSSEPQAGLDVGLLLAGGILSTLAFDRLFPSRAERGIIRRVIHSLVAAGGYFLTGLLGGVLTVLGFIALVLIPLAAAVIGAGYSLLRLRRNPRPVNHNRRYGRHLEVVLVSVSLSLLAVAASGPFSDDALLIAAIVTIAGGGISSALVAYGAAHAVADQQNLKGRVVALGEGLAVLMLHVIFAVAPTMIVIWNSVGGAS